MLNRLQPKSHRSIEASVAVSRGAELARRVAAEYGTSDVFNIAECAGVKIIYESWALVTIGECEPERNFITVNARAIEIADDTGSEVERAIIAHELGHIFEWRTRVNPGDAEEDREGVAHGFSTRLLELSLLPVKYEGCGRERFMAATR